MYSTTLCNLIRHHNGVIMQSVRQLYMYSKRKLLVSGVNNPKMVSNNNNNNLYCINYSQRLTLYSTYNKMLWPKYKQAK